MHYIQRCLFLTKHVERTRSHADMTPHSLADFQIQNLSIFLEVFLWYVVAARCSLRATAFHQQHVFVLLTCRPCAGVCSVGSRGNMGLRMMRACMLQVQRSSISAHANCLGRFSLRDNNLRTTRARINMPLPQTFRCCITAVTLVRFGCCRCRLVCHSEKRKCDEMRSAEECHHTNKQCRAYPCSVAACPCSLIFSSFMDFRRAAHVAEGIRFRQ